LVLIPFYVSFGEKKEKRRRRKREKGKGKGGKREERGKANNGQTLT
jgi:hypothetical protein